MRTPILTGFVSAALGAMLCTTLCAAEALDAWHQKAAEIRVLSENDFARAEGEARQLQAQLSVNAPAADRVLALNLLARAEIYLAQTDLAAQHIQQAMELARLHNDKVGQIEADLNIALNAVNQGQIDAMIAAVNQSMSLLDGIDRPELLGEAMLRAAMMYLRLGQIDDSIAVSVREMDIARRSGNPLALAYAHQGLAISFDQSFRYREAFEHYSQMRDQGRLAHSKILEADGILGMGEVSVGLGELSKGEQSIREAIAIYRQLGGPFFVDRALFLLSRELIRQKRYVDSQAILNELVASYEQHSNRIGLWWTLISRSENYQLMGQLAAAKKDAARAYELAGKIGLPVYMSGSVRRLSAVAAGTDDFKQAYQYDMEARDITAKIEREKNSDRIIELANRYENAATQRHIDELIRHNEQQAIQQRWLLTMLGGSIVILIGSVYFLRRLRRANHMLAVANVQLRQSQNETNLLNETLELRVDERTVQLQQSRNLLVESQRIAHVGSWKMNLVNNVLTWSDEIYRIFEIDPQQFGASYEAFLNTVHPDDRMMVDDVYKKSLESREHFETDHRLLLPDGRIKYVHERCETLFGDDGKALRSLGTVQDITERKQAEEELRRVYEFTDRLINTIPDPVFVKDRQHKWLRLNDAFCTFIGYPREELIGKSDCDFFPADQAAIFWEKDELVFTSGLENINEERFTDAHGMTHIIQTKKVVISVGDDEDILIGVIHDITERQQAQQRMELLKRAIDMSSDAIYLHDEQLRFSYVNTAACYSLGYSREELLAMGPHDIDHESKREVVQEIMNSSPIGSAFMFETRHRKRDGQEFSVEVSGSHFEENGKKFGLSVVRDITERKRFEVAREAALAEAERLAKQRRDFLSHMSHELRTPLNGILGYTQLLQRDRMLDERNADALNVVRQSGEHLLSLIDDILDLARIDSGHFQLDIGDISLSTFLRVICDIIGIRTREKAIKFEFELAHDLPTGIRGDERRLRQVLLNLLANAVKFTDLGKVVLRVVRRDTSRLVFEVKDTGIGIAKGELDFIFEPFEQSGDVSLRSGGTGLGLSISRQLVRLMGGDIEVDSRIGQGSSFRFELALPEVDLAATPERTDTTSEYEQSRIGDEIHAELLVAPPQKEMQALHHLAQIGNMRDIAHYAEHIAGLDARYQPFAAHLRQLAEAYQSQAILVFVERYLNDTAT